MDWNPKLFHEREQKDYWNVSKNIIINYINWEILLKAICPKTFASFNFNLNILF